MKLLRAFLFPQPAPTRAHLQLPHLGTRLISSNGEFGIVREVRHGRIICTRYTPELSYVITDPDGDDVNVYEPGKKIRDRPAVLRPVVESDGGDWIDVTTSFKWRALPKGTFSLPSIFNFE